MQNDIGKPAKPRAESLRPELTRLPELNARRLRYRRIWAKRFRWFIRLFTLASVSQIENFPESGPAVLVFNHLGALDVILGLACVPEPPDAIGKVELIDRRIIGKMLERYGVIWIHRGTPDLKALRYAQQALREGRYLAIAPEARQTLTGGLEEATGGAAFLALRTGAPVYPIALTGTEDAHVRANWRRLRRPRVSIRFGGRVPLDEFSPGSEGVKAATEKIMHALAELLPESYRGAYAR